MSSAAKNRRTVPFCSPYRRRSRPLFRKSCIMAIPLVSPLCVRAAAASLFRPPRRPYSAVGMKGRRTPATWEMGMVWR